MLLIAFFALWKWLPWVYTHLQAWLLLCDWAKGQGTGGTQRDGRARFGQLGEGKPLTRATVKSPAFWSRSETGACCAAAGTCLQGRMNSWVASSVPGASSISVGRPCGQPSWHWWLVSVWLCLLFLQECLDIVSGQAMAAEQKPASVSGAVWMGRHTSGDSCH